MLNIRDTAFSGFNEEESEIDVNTDKYGVVADITETDVTDVTETFRDMKKSTVVPESSSSLHRWQMH